MKNPALTDEQTLEEVISCLAENIPVDTQGACDQRTVFEILIRAACMGDSVENTCRTLQDAPCGNDIRYHLEKYDDMADLETRMNKALQDRLPPRISKGKQCLAADLNLIPWYGKPNPSEEPYIYRGQAKAGTCSFYACATLYVIRKNKRVTIAVISVRRDDTDVAVITRLSDKISPLNLRMKRLLIDRGFFSVPVIRWLKAPGIPFEMPVVIRGKKGGTRQLLRGGRSYKTEYTMKSTQYGSVTFDVWIVCCHNKGKYGKHGIKYMAYAVHRITLNLRAVYNDYRRRFGIETSYRIKNKCRIRTTSKNPVVRFLYIGIAFILTNIWIYLAWTYISCPRKGGRLIFHELFPLKLMLTFLCQLIDKKYGLIKSVYL